MLSTQYLHLITSRTLSFYEGEGCGITHCEVWAQLLNSFVGGLHTVLTKAKAGVAILGRGETFSATCFVVWLHHACRVQNMLKSLTRGRQLQKICY